MISSIVFINSKGEILIYRTYKDDITRTETMHFCTSVIARKESKESPIVQIDDASFIHMAHKDIILLATSKGNVNAGMIIYFLYQLVRLCKSYFGDLDENSIRKNFVLIYELLDEVMDYGMPQILDPDLLKQYIQENGLKPELNNNIQKLKELTGRVTGQSCSWRPEFIVYKQNEIFVDVIESVNVLISLKGTILRADVRGEVAIKALLSGMPECKFGMNDKLCMQNDPKKPATNNQDKGITIDDLKFHQCVRLPKFEKERTITFVPPDGLFQLMTYRITENINIPFKIIPVINEFDNKIEVRIKLKSIFDKTIFANNVVLKVPCPNNTAAANIVAGIGRAKYEAEHHGIMWRIKKYPGDFEAILRCDIDLSQTNSEKQWVKPPISIDFQVPMFTASGLRVRFLRVLEKSGYKTAKWIKYVTKAGDYLHRI